MAYTPIETGGLRFDREVHGQPQPWTVTHRAIEYPGDVIVADTVNPEWGMPLVGDACFRIVFYTVPRRIPASQIQDPRIAMAVPRRSRDPARESLSHEIRAIHEARERYVTRQDPETRAVGVSLEEREASLVGELARQEALSYSQGRVYAQTGLTIKPAEVFGEASVRSWVDRLVGELFLQAFPSLPLDHQELTAAVTPEVVQAVFRGLFQGDPDDLETAAAFGPGLGLSRRDAPGTLDAQACRVVSIIQAEIVSRGGEMESQELLTLLCSKHGLNRGLATLYLLAFVLQGRGEVTLKPDHSIRTRDDEHFLSDRITWDLVTEVRFTHTMANELQTLRARPVAEWNAVVPYASVLVNGLHLTRDPAEIEQMDLLFADALVELGRRLEDSRRMVAGLLIDLEESAEAALGALHRLEVLCAARGYREFHSQAVNSGDGPSGLREALDIYQRLERLSDLAPEVARTRTYLDEMTFGRGHRELELKRDSTLARIWGDSLIANPSLWRSMEESFRLLLREYTSEYLSHHARYHEASAALVTSLESRRAQVEALSRFNEVPEFGGPLSAELPGRYRDLRASIRTCTTREEDISLDEAPLCRDCLLPLDEDLSRRDATRVMADLESALGEYNRRLSSEGVRRILADSTKEQLEQFIDLVQVSDLSALANVLDGDVLDFLCRFVRHS